MAECRSWVGRIGEELAAGEHVQEVVNKVHAQFEHEAKTLFDNCQVLKYKQQLVAGKNYFVHVKCTPAHDRMAPVYAHLRIYEGIDEPEPRLDAWKLVETNTPIEYFN